ncbi:phenylacetic acid degradation protein [Deinococcus aerolatus]|uniref:Phenylacetic acid degradation protein n=1 Tax=Deinococcus aerolatus TaxID=522487 RepID=A0ABQ2FYT3_9DEIO|nr:PaaI family thioesterase [Deinococcus aerolatus]GGL66874.1 phenylacetic acid degradation protein [Deinococcus aerolatus]
MTQTQDKPMETSLPQRTRTYTWQDPLIGAGAAPGLSGLAYLRGMARGDFPPPPIGQTLGFTIGGEEDVQEGRVTFRMRPEEFHYNPIGSVHGGVYATLLDSALGCAIHTLLPAGVGYTTLDLAVKYLRPLQLGLGEVRAVAEVISVSRRVATATAQIVDDAGKVYATATTTCLVMRPERAAAQPIRASGAQETVAQEAGQ